MDISKDTNAVELLLEKLRHKQPHSIPVYNVVRNLRQKKWGETQVFVDDATTETCTVLCLCPSIHTNPHSDTAWYVYSDDENTLKSMLHKVRVSERCLDGLNHRGTISFLCLDDKFINTVNQYMNECSYSISTTATYLLFVRFLDGDVIKNTKQQTPPLPDGYTMAPLKRRYAKLLVSTKIVPTTVQCVERLIATFPSIAVYAPDGKPVSWSLLMPHGEPSFGYTVPEYRNKKLSQIRGAEMMSRLFDEGYNAMLLATGEDNVPMLKVFKKLPGLIPVYKTHFLTFEMTPSLAPKL